MVKFSGCCAASDQLPLEGFDLERGHRLAGF